MDGSIQWARRCQDPFATPANSNSNTVASTSESQKARLKAKLLIYWLVLSMPLRTCNIHLPSRLPQRLGKAELFSILTEFVTTYALHQIQAQHELLLKKQHNNKDLERCTRGFKSSMGLPCMHLIHKQILFTNEIRRIKCCNCLIYNIISGSTSLGLPSI